jgi:cytochrome bd-type quinol oxidase subunit 2
MSTRARLTGPGRILVAVYAVLAVAATGRSGFQIVDRFAEAPIAFSLSAVAAVVYILATLALAFRWDRLAWVTIGFELLGVLVVGTLTLAAPATLGLESVELIDRAFGREGTVWALYGLGYLGVPLALPVIGLLYLARSRRATTVSAG